jgi:hypothetical protein
VADTKNRLVIQFDGDPSGLQDALRNIGKDLQKFDDKVNKGSSGIGGLSDSVSKFDEIAGTGFSRATSGVEGLVSKLGSLGPAIGVTAVAAAALFAAYKFAETGEELARQEKQFRALAEQNKISADLLVDGLEEVAGGLVDTDDLIKIANKSIVNMGYAAKDLPGIFELAQKSVKVYGGDATTNLELISSAIGSLQTRSLKQIGINVDAEATFKSYAKTLGVHADQLTDAEKKQALLNAVLEQGKTKFAEISTGVNDGSISNGLKRIATGFDSIKDAIAQISYTSFGKAIGGALNEAGKSLGFFGDSVAELFGKQRTLSKELERTTYNLEKYEESRKAMSLDPAMIKFYDDEIAKLKAKTAQLKLSVAEEKKAKEDAAPAGPESVPASQRAKSDEQIKSEQETLTRINILKAESQAVELQAEADHQNNIKLLKLSAAFDNEERINLETQKILDKNTMEYDSQVAKNMKIKDSNERAAADELAMDKKLAADQAAIDKKLTETKIEETKRRELVQRAGLEIAGNLIQAGLNLAEQGSSAQKALMVAEAIRNTYAGATRAFADFPFPISAAVAGSVILLGLTNVAKITGANEGALVTGGTLGKDTEPFLLSKNEIVAPAKSFDEVIEGTARQRGFVQGDENNSEGIIQAILDLAQEIRGLPRGVVVNGDFLADDIYINRLAEKLLDATEFRGARVS